MTTLQSILGGGVALALTFGAAYLGSQFPIDEWYAGLAKPAWNPPNWLFAPVWTALYLLMAISAWLIWRGYGVRGAAAALVLFLVQLALNVGWSWLFFGRHQIGLALLEILALWFAILATLLAFWRLNAWSGALLVPYLLWVSFASFLNLAIWRLNP